VRADRQDSVGTPHSGIATVTIHFEGASWAEETDQVRHVVPAGGVDWVQAGSGVWHRGGPAPGTDVAAFQLWLALDEDRELEPAASRYFRAEELPVQGPVRVVLGAFQGARSPVPVPVPAPAGCRANRDRAT
jgi:redox-sensitive bicupin YhaK (pirin superfamily)